jgi:hypothetical protein
MPDLGEFDGGFTFGAYADLLVACRHAGYEFLTVREYLSADAGELPERFVILRHDVDRKPENARDMAQLEADHGAASTYYFRTIPKTFRPAYIETIEELGHEVGYHYEDLDRADGDARRARKLFGAELAKLRTVATVDTVCMHGNPLTPHDNREMWNGSAGDGFEAFDLLGEAYLSMDFTDVAYFSDTGRTWRDGALKVKDHTMGEGENPAEVGTTRELVQLLESGRLPRVCLLVHPNRWARTYPERVGESVKDVTVNVGKHALNVVRGLQDTT